MHITNIVAKCTTTPLDLDDAFVCLTCDGYNVSKPSKFPAVFLRLEHETCALFKTGTVTINGIKSVRDITNVYTELWDAFSSTGRRFSGPSIVNIVASFRTDNKVNLEVVSQRHKDICSYTPELSNSAEISLEKSCKVLLHSSGNGIITGAKSVDELNDCWFHVVNIVYWY